MKQVIYIFSVMLLALFSCTDDILNSDQEKVIEGNKVQLNFQVNDIPDFKEITTKAADENTVETISLMTFDEGGSFLGSGRSKGHTRVGYDFRYRFCIGSGRNFYNPFYRQLQMDGWSLCDTERRKRIFFNVFIDFRDG